MTGGKYIEFIRTLRSLYQVMDSRTFQISVLTRTDTSIALFFILKNEDDQYYDRIHVFFFLKKKYEIIFAVILWTVRNDSVELFFLQGRQRFQKNLKSDDYFVFNVKTVIENFDKIWFFWKWLLRKMFTWCYSRKIRDRLYIFFSFPPIVSSIARSLQDDVPEFLIDSRSSWDNG